MKKAAAILLVAALFLTWALPALAADGAVLSVENLTVRLEDVCGGEILVTVRVTEDSGIACGCVAVSYDPTAFLFEGKNEVRPDCDGALFIRRGRASEGYPVLLEFTDTLPAGGAVAEFSLKLMPTAKVGEYPLTVVTRAPLCDAAGKGLEAELQPGIVALTAYEPCESLTLQVLPETDTVAPGESFRVAYRIAGLPATGLTEFDFYTEYDEALFELESLSIADTLGGFGVIGFVDEENGHICGTVGSKTFFTDSTVAYAVFTAKTEGEGAISVYSCADPEDPRTPITAFSAVVDGDILRYELPVLQPGTVRIALKDLVGDINGDHVLSITDVSSLLQFLASASSEGLVASKLDVNADSSVGITDVSTLLNMLEE